MANGGHGAMGGHGGNSQNPTPGEMMMRRLGALEAEQRHIWRVVAAMDTHAERLAAHDQQIRFVWRSVDGLDACLDDVKRRLFNTILAIAGTAIGLIVAIVMQQIGLG
jgi:hypothetical protein